MGDRAADGPAVPHRAIGNTARHELHIRPGRTRHRAVLDPRMGDPRAYTDGIARHLNTVETADTADIDQQVRLGKTQVHHGAQRLSAAHDPGLAVGTAERSQRVLERSRALMIEFCGFHAASPSRFVLAAAIAASTRRGVNGVSVTSAPILLSASLIALPMAAGVGMVTPSPMPLMPYSVKGDGLSMWSIR